MSLHRLSMICLFILLVACQSSGGGEVDETPTTAIDTVTPAPTDTSVPTEMPATATHIPPLPTILPTATTPPTVELIYEPFVGGRPADDWDKANVAQFESLYPHIQITRRGGNLYTSPVPVGIYQIIRSPNNAPDVMSGFMVGQLREMVADGLIADISDLWESEGWDEIFPPGIKNLATIDGKQYFVPQAFQWNPIWYRTDIFAEYNLTPPETWEALLQACDTLHDAGIVPIAVSSRSWTPPSARWFTILNLRLNGIAFHEDLMKGEARYDDPRVRTVFEYWAEMFDHHCFAETRTNYNIAAQQIFSGEAAMYNLGEWLSESYPEGMPDTFDFFTLPILNPDVPQAEIVHMYGSYMLTSSEHPEQAREFLKYVASTPSQTTNGEALGRMVSNNQVEPSLYSDVYLKGYDLVANLPAMTQLYEFNTHPDMATLGLRVFASFYAQQDVEDSIATLQREWERTFGTEE